MISIYTVSLIDAAIVVFFAYLYLRKLSKDRDGNWHPHLNQMRRFNKNGSWSYRECTQSEIEEARDIEDRNAW